MIAYIIQLFRDLFLNIHRTFHRTSSASECCHNSCVCMNEGEASTSSSSSKSECLFSQFLKLLTETILVYNIISINRMTEMNSQQQTDKNMETTSELIKHFNDHAKKPQKNNE